MNSKVWGRHRSEAAVPEMGSVSCRKILWEEVSFQSPERKFQGIGGGDRVSQYGAAWARL